jgi:CheY-like chemotaxis protein
MTTPEILILNVDDQEPERYIKSRDLRAVGFAVIEAKTGNEALRLVEQHRPPVVLLDVQLPDINGYEVCRYIKQKWPTS